MCLLCSYGGLLLLETKLGTYNWLLVHFSLLPFYICASQGNLFFFYLQKVYSYSESVVKTVKYTICYNNNDDNVVVIILKHSTIL